MAKEDALSILLADGSTADKLKESYSELVDMVQKGAISTQIKNTNLSGNPEAGSVEVRRLMTAESQAYGTARTAGKGDKVKNNGVVVNLDQDKEIIEEVEWKDIQFYGIDGIIAKRQVNHLNAMVRELDRAFFTEAESAGSAETISSTAIEDVIEELIQSVETVENDNVDGVDREMLVLTLKPHIYGKLLNRLDVVTNPNGQSYNAFHGVRVFSNTRQTKDAICMAIGAIAQPVVSQPYVVEPIPLSNAVAIELFYHYGTKAVMPDLIKYADMSTFSV